MSAANWMTKLILLNICIVFVFYSLCIYHFDKELKNDYEEFTLSIFVKSEQCKVDMHNLIRFGSFYGIPAYYLKKGTQSISSKTILSLATTCDINRLHKAIQISTNFNGPISISIYIDSLENEIQNQTVCNKIKNMFDDINNAYDIHISLLYPDYSNHYYQQLKLAHPYVPLHAKFPLNAMRNLVVSQVNTRYFAFIDVDFIYMSKAINSFNNNEKSIENDVGKKVYVIPAFEWHSAEAERKFRNINGHMFNDKNELLQLINSGDILPNHDLDWKPAEFCTNYDKWYNINTTKNYKIEYCSPYYEPCIIWETKYAQNIKKYHWDNDCIGRSQDGVLHIAALAYDCWEFEVLHDIFIIHDYRTSADIPVFSVWEKAMNIRYAQEYKTYCDNPNTCWNTDVCKQFYERHTGKFKLTFIKPYRYKI